MTFIPLEQALKISKSLRACPVCFGTGEMDCMDNMGPAVPKCPTCKGLCFVDLGATCCCGMPAILFKDDLIYCGRELCLTNLKHRHSGGYSC